MPLEYRPQREDETVEGIVAIMRHELEGTLTRESVDAYIAENPQDIKGYVMKAVIIQRRHPEESLEMLDGALEYFGESDLLFHMKGMAHEFTGDRDAAIEYFQKAIAVNELNVASRISLATFLNRTGQHDKAREYWKDLINLMPELHVGWNGLARSSIFTGDYDRAVKHYTAALFCAENNEDEIDQSRYLSCRAHAYFQRDTKGDFDAGITDIRKSHELDPKEGAGILKLGIEKFVKQGNLKKMIQLEETLLELYPDGAGDLTQYYALGTAYVVSGQGEKVNPLFERGIASGNDPTKLLELQGKLLTESGRLEDALPVWEKLVRESGDMFYAVNIIQIAEQLGDTAKVKKYQAALRNDPEAVTQLLARFGPEIIPVALGMQLDEYDRRIQGELSADYRKLNRARRRLESQGVDISDLPNLLSNETEKPKKQTTVRREGEKIGRNDPCPCDSGKKYKKCCARC